MNQTLLFTSTLSLLVLQNVFSFTQITNDSSNFVSQRAHRQEPRRLALKHRNLSRNDEQQEREIDKVTEKNSYNKVDIESLMKQKDQRETMINRLKFQLNEFKATVAESERRQKEAEEKVAEIRNENDGGTVSEGKAIDVMTNEYRQEKEKLSSELESSTKKLQKVTIDSKKSLEKAKGTFQKQKEKLLKEIQIWNSELEDKAGKLESMKKEMKLMTDKNVKEIEANTLIAERKEVELVNLNKKKREMELEIGQCKSELESIGSSIAKNKKLLEELEQTQKSTAKKMEKDKNLLAKLKEKFGSEKNDLSEQLNSYSAELMRAKEEAETNLNEVEQLSKSRSKDLHLKLQEQIYKTTETSNQIKRAKEESLRTKDQSQKESARLQDREKRRLKSLKRVNIEAKEELRRQISVMNDKVATANKELRTANFETKELKEQSELYELKIKELSENHKKLIRDLESRRKENSEFYSESQNASISRMENFVIKFRQRLRRREKNLDCGVKEARMVLKKKIDLETEEMETQTGKFLSEKQTEIDQYTLRAEKELSLARQNFDDQVLDLRNKLLLAQAKAAKQIQKIEEDNAVNLNNERVRIEKEKYALIKKKDDEIVRFEEAGKLRYTQLKIQLNDKLRKIEEKKMNLEKNLIELNESIEDYEAERQSFRKLAKLTWRATRGKLRRLRSK